MRVVRQRKLGIALEDRILAVNWKFSDFILIDVADELAKLKSSGSRNTLLMVGHYFHTSSSHRKRYDWISQLMPLIEPVGENMDWRAVRQRVLNRAFSSINHQCKSLGKMFTRGEVSTRNVSGPIGMAKIYGILGTWPNFCGITGWFQWS